MATAAPGATVTAENEAPEVDEDGFSVRPKSTETWTNDKNSFYSSSDSDSGVVCVTLGFVILNILLLCSFNISCFR